MAKVSFKTPKDKNKNDLETMADQLKGAAWNQLNNAQKFDLLRDVLILVAKIILKQEKK